MCLKTFFFFLLAAAYGSVMMNACVCSAGPIFRIVLVSDFMDVQKCSVGSTDRIIL